MCIIFGMIERNVACCHACLHPYGTRARDWCTCKPLAERKTNKCSVLAKRFFIKRLFSERRLPLSLSLSFSPRIFTSYAAPLLITFPLLILVVLLRPIRLHSLPNLFFLLYIYLLFLLGGQTRDGSATVTVVPDSSLPSFSDDEHFHEIVPLYTNFGATWWHGR